MIRILGRLQLDATLLLVWGRGLGTEVAVVMRVGRVLWRRLVVGIVIVVVWLLVCRLVGRWWPRRRCHPCCTAVGLPAERTATTSVKATIQKTRLVHLYRSQGCLLDTGSVSSLELDGDLRESKEDKEGDGYDDGKSDPATPTVPGRVVAITIEPIVAVFKSEKGTTILIVVRLTNKCIEVSKKAWLRVWKDGEKSRQRKEIVGSG